MYRAAWQRGVAASPRAIGEAIAQAKECHAWMPIGIPASFHMIDVALEHVEVELAPGEGREACRQVFIGACYKSEPGSG
jgi:hypothetical protein